jgi:hypothetical protein
MRDMRENRKEFPRNDEFPGRIKWKKMRDKFI